MDITDYESQIPILISDIYRHWREAIDSIAKSFDFTRTQWHIIGKLCCRGPRLSQAELCELSGMSRAQLTRALNVLEDKGVIVRHLDPTNRRINYVELKEPNADYIEQIQAINNQINQLILDELAPQAQKQLVRSLTKVSAITTTIKEKMTTQHTK